MCCAVLQGQVSVPLEDVIRKRRIAAAWPLQGVESGVLHMALEWIPTSGETPGEQL